MRRRQFIAGLGGAAAWPIVARGQQQVPVVSYLQFGQAQGDLDDGLTQGWLTGLTEAGFDPGRNVIVDAVPVPNMDQARAAVTAQIRRKPAVIFGNMGLALIAKGITTTVPIIFATVAQSVLTVVQAQTSPAFGCGRATRIRSSSSCCTNLPRPRRLLVYWCTGPE